MNLAQVFPFYQKAFQESQTPLSTRAFLGLRWKLTPYLTMAARMPLEGKILDLGCGHGLLSAALALSAPGREVLGIDHDESRIALAKKAAEGIGNLRYQTGGLLESLDPIPAASQCGIAMIDVLHYFDHEAQERVILKAKAALREGGILLFREVDPSAGAVSAWNRLYEKCATATGFTRSRRSTELSFRSPEQWRALLEKCGFVARAEPCGHFLFADILFLGIKPQAQAGT